MSWRVFHHPRRTGDEAAVGVLVSLECETIPSEADAKAAAKQLLDEGFRGVSVRPPESTKILKGMELRAWIAGDEPAGC